MRTRSPLRTLLSLLASVSSLALAGCLPDVDVDESRITAPRVLALRAEPAEAAPGTATTFTALVAGPDGTITDAPLDWAFCNARRPLAELGPVNRACYAATGSDLVTIGSGASVAAPLPRTGCRLFGPEVPPAQPGETPGRVVDADLTGGYQQPVRVLGPGATSILETRIGCGPAGATPDQARDYRQRYRDNAHPSITAVTLLGDSGAALPQSSEGATLVGPGQRVTVRVTWPSCPLSASCGDAVCDPDELATSCPADCASPGPLACGGAERYLVLDPATRTLVTRREAIRVAWFSSAGALELERSGRASADPGAEADNHWLAPTVPGRATLWVVVRDERGGVTWSERSIIVQATTP